ncbi:uncharacterized protein LOC131294797 [Anopheles ziemanni]|uniref:uncharacterized protein LOC131265371 n=1 Tax=Anopheles coustani TaxID=139045 RepID=UPI00265B365B|nr:uncharacterized protein LOC131265371 [Anopheles coustani]XP_058178823.1 uncharacterized protein LOC131294797 [Anopheles ziemanni]
MFSSSAYREWLSTGDGPASYPKHTFNPTAKPFVCPVKRAEAMYGGDTAGDSKYTSDKARKARIAFVGPTSVPVNARIWNTVGRTSPDPVCPVQSQLPSGMIPTCNGHLKMYMEPAAHYANCPANQASFGPTLHPDGFLQLNLRDGIMVGLTLNSLKVINKRMNIAISVSGDSTTVAMSHPNGIIYQYGAQVDIVACDAKKSNHFIRYARMWHKGISFTSDRCALIYLVDAAGTRTTSETITMDLEADYVNQVFYNGAACSTQTMAELSLLQRHASYHLTGDGGLVYQIHGYRITQANDGQVKLVNATKQCIIRTSPTNGSATVTTPSIHCTASLGATSHLFVRCEEKRMHFDGAAFVVRNAGHSAGFDEINRLRVY